MILCSEDFPNHHDNCHHCGELNEKPNQLALQEIEPSSKYAIAAKIIGREEDKNFLVFHEWVWDRTLFSTWLQTQEQATQGTVNFKSTSYRKEGIIN